MNKKDSPVDDYTKAPTLTFESAAVFDTWLSQNYQQQAGVWVKVAKKLEKIMTDIFLRHPKEQL